MGSPKRVERVKQLGSLCNFTLDEVVKNLTISAEECHQIMQNPSSSSSSSSSSSFSSSSPPMLFDGNINTSGPQAKKSIDDVWYHIACQKHPNAKKSPYFPPAEINIALKDLIRTDAIDPAGNQQSFIQNPVPLMANIDHRMVSQEVLMPMPVQAIVGLNFLVWENKMMMDLRCLDKQLRKTVPAKEIAMADKYSSDSPAQATKRTRVFADERMAKTVEKRQRRMIKNRESAARSRAKKQAYTNQLQHNVLQLQTTNNLLKKRKEVNILLDWNSISAPRYQLRRTSSTQF